MRLFFFKKLFILGSVCLSIFLPPKLRSQIVSGTKNKNRRTGSSSVLSLIMNEDFFFTSLSSSISKEFPRRFFAIITPFSSSSQFVGIDWTPYVFAASEYHHFKSLT